MWLECDSICDVSHMFLVLCRSYLTVCAGVISQGDITIYYFCVHVLCLQIKLPQLNETLSALNCVHIAGGSKSLFCGEFCCPLLFSWGVTTIMILNILSLSMELQVGVEHLKHTRPPPPPRPPPKKKKKKKVKFADHMSVVSVLIMGMVVKTEIDATVMLWEQT